MQWTTDYEHHWRPDQPYAVEGTFGFFTNTFWYVLIMDVSAIVPLLFLRFYFVHNTALDKRRQHSVEYVTHYWCRDKIRRFWVGDGKAGGSYLRCYRWPIGGLQWRDWNATYDRRKELQPINRNESRANRLGLQDHWSSQKFRNDGILLPNKHTEVEDWNVTYCRKFSAHCINMTVQSTHNLLCLFIHLATHVTLDTSI